MYSTSTVQALRTEYCKVTVPVLYAVRTVDFMRSDLAFHAYYSTSIDHQFRWKGGNDREAASRNLAVPARADTEQLAKLFRCAQTVK